MSFSFPRCFGIVYQLFSNNIISKDEASQLHFACVKEGYADSNDLVSRPMVWIGIYIAVASLFCIIAMTADLLHGFRNKKFWFPCRYFSLNAASITVIAITMKLPVDLTTPMNDEIGHLAKRGSLSFLCVMMTNLMPSLASMDNKTLIANVAGLSILVITVIVNICIQLHNGAMFYNMIAYLYIGIIFLLLIIIISSSLAIPTSKDILESKYQARKKIFIAKEHLQNTQMSKVEKLRQQVTRYWVMAESGSPQFVMASTPLSIASGIICVVVMVLNSILLSQVISYYKYYASNDVVNISPYKWSTIAIFLTQSIGVVVGTIAPIARCFIIFNFKLTTKWNMNHFMFLRVERYWIQKLNEWKQSNICFVSSNQRVRRLICNSKDIILCFCIGFQKVIIVFCKVICVMVTLVPVTVISSWKSLNARLFPPHITSGSDDADEDLTSYVLQIDNNTELSKKRMKRITRSVNSCISKAEKEQNNNLLKFLKKSTGFEGVVIFDIDHVRTSLSYEVVNNWSLPIVTLTCIAINLPNIPSDANESLLCSVGEGLLFTHLVEEVLNCTSEYVNLQKASSALWHEMENKCVWLNNPLSQNLFKGKSTIEIVKWFADKSEQIVNQNKEDITGESVDTTRNTLIAANSMYRATQTILLRFQRNIEPLTNEHLFAHLNGIIADILCACLTNIPRVIKMKYQERVIEKREESVKVAAMLLGKTTKIIESLAKRELPSMLDDKMAYIDEWRLYFKQSIP